MSIQNSYSFSVNCQRRIINILFSLLHPKIIINNVYEWIINGDYTIKDSSYFKITHKLRQHFIVVYLQIMLSCTQQIMLIDKMMRSFHLHDTIFITMVSYE